MQENLLTTEQVARYLKVDKFTIYRLVTQKKIPAFKVGNQWRFKRAMIDAWLMENSNVRLKRFDFQDVVDEKSGF
jgi:excisionase family DNA binding protein